jgi:hypothetical protein
VNTTTAAEAAPDWARARRAIESLRWLSALSTHTHLSERTQPPYKYISTNVSQSAKWGQFSVS